MNKMHSDHINRNSDNQICDNINKIFNRFNYKYLIYTFVVNQSEFQLMQSDFFQCKF